MPSLATHSTDHPSRVGGDLWLHSIPHPPPLHLTLNSHLALHIHQRCHASLKCQPHQIRLFCCKFAEGFQCVVRTNSLQRNLATVRTNHQPASWSFSLHPTTSAGPTQSPRFLEFPRHSGYLPRQPAESPAASPEPHEAKKFNPRSNVRLFACRVDRNSLRH